MLFRVAVTPASSEALQEFAFKCGYDWGSVPDKTQVHYLNSPFLFFDMGKKIIYRSSDCYNRTLSLEDAFKYLKGEEIIEIDNFPVRFTSRGIVFKDITIDKEIIQKIYRRLFKCH